MRVRLQVLLPLSVALLVAAAFLLAALTVGTAVRTAPAAGAPGAAARIVILWGLFATLATLVLGAGLARLVVAPLRRMRERAQRLAEQDGTDAPVSPLAEIQDVVRGISRAARELRARHARELRERSELAALVDVVSEGIVQVDAAGRIVRVNRAGRDLLRLAPDPVGQPTGSLVRNAELRRFLGRTSAGKAADATEILLDGRRVLVTSVPLEEGGGVVTLVDLTDLRRLEEVRRDFVANASHELKTPLTSIRGYTETLLADDLPPAERRQFLETIGRNAERLQRIVDDLLDLSRLESGRWHPEIGLVDVAELAASAWQPFTERARRSGVACTIERQSDRPAAADLTGLEQVFTNLYDNALRYTPTGGRIHVRIREDLPDEAPPGGTPRRLAEAARDHPWLILEISDTGSGIPRDALPRIFERFYRVDPARSRAEGGTGLGLSIVKHIMESMGGVVTAESELGKGTTVRLWLPAWGGAPRYVAVTDR